MTDQKESPQLIPQHGGYRELQSYQMAEIDKTRKALEARRKGVGGGR